MSNQTLTQVPDSTEQIPPKTLKVGIVREELVALTQDPLIAMVLNQLLYWTQRVKDYDLYVKEEREGNPALRHGWVYKSADELSEESLVCVSKATMRRYLLVLKVKGWIDERVNPFIGWDKTIQYRVNLRKLGCDLQEKGYKLPPPFLLFEEFENPQISSISKNDPSMFQNDPSMFQNETSMFQNETSMFQNETSNTETTTETINKDYQQRQGAQAFFKKMIEIWKKNVPFENPHLTKERQHRLEALLQEQCHNDLSEWERLCKRVKASTFLMKGGDRKWRVSLDWILKEDNFFKVLEGKYDDPEFIEAAKQEVVQREHEKEVSEVLASIRDPVWKKWCSRLAQGIKLNDFTVIESPLSLSTLKAIADAWFIECEDDKLIWIGSHNETILNKINELKFNIMWVFKKDYPKVRSYRTRLVEG